MNPQPKSRGLAALPLNSPIPNILTVLALCAGMSAIRFALLERWEVAVAAICVAAVFDGLDGRIARLLKGTSKFGAELDSLSDFISFGVAPALIVFLWVTQDLKGLGWIASLAYSTSAALRLARFNTMLEDENQPVWKKRFFIGMPSPAAAGVALLPLGMSFMLEQDFLRSPHFMTVWLFFVGFLMISRIPTYSFKVARIKHEYVLPTLVLVGLLAAVMVSFPWFVLSVLCLLYLLSLPFSFREYRRLERLEPDATSANADLVSDDGAN